MQMLTHDGTHTITPAPAPLRPTTPAWITRLFTAIDAFDVDTVLSCLSPMCEFRFGNMVSVYGRDSLRGPVSSLFRAIKRIQHQDLNTWVHPEVTICSGTITYVRHDDTAHTVPFTAVFQLDDQLIRDYLIYIDTAHLFA